MLAVIPSSVAVSKLRATLQAPKVKDLQVTWKVVTEWRENEVTPMMTETQARTFLDNTPMADCLFACLLETELRHKRLIVRAK